MFTRSRRAACRSKTRGCFSSSRAGPIWIGPLVLNLILSTQLGVSQANGSRSNMPLLNLSISQFLWVFVAASLLLKLRPSRPFLRWLASGGLTCHKIPTDDELRPLKYREPSGDSKKDHNKKSGNKSKSPSSKSNDQSIGGPGRANEFKIRSSDLIKLNLNKVGMDSRVLLAAPYGEDLEWVADLAAMSLVSFILTQTLFYYSQRAQEYNFSLVWIFLVIIQCLLILLQLTAIYFRNQVSIGERSLCIVSGCLFLLVAMMVLIFDGPRLELTVHESLLSLSREDVRQPSMDALLDPHEFDIPPPQTLPSGPRPASLILVKLVIAVICSIIGVIFTFPGLRYGQLHESLLEDSQSSRLQKTFYNLNYITPIMVICLWIPAMSRNLLKRLEVDLFKDDTNFDLFRIATCILTDVVRLLVVRRYVQTFLISSEKRLNSIRYRGGTTTNKQIQITIASMNNYANVACMQYILPALVCLFTSIMYATLYYYNNVQETPQSVDGTTIDGPSRQLASLRYLFGGDQPGIIESAEEYLHRARQLVSSKFTRNMFGFATWWFHFAWSCTSTIGVVYHKYFTH